MEVEGTVAIYNRSISKNGLRYVDFYGDGDTKSFKNIENTYPGMQVRKLECIGHIQKRVGNRLRKQKKSVKGLGGKGGLNDAMIDKLQNYYGISIRRNVGKDVATMKSAIWAGFFHVTSSKNRLLHDHCPKGKDSWCGYQLDVANKTELFKHGAGISDAVIKHIKPILVELSNDSLLQKSVFMGRHKIRTKVSMVQFGDEYQNTLMLVYASSNWVFMMLSLFNVGNKTTLLMYEKLGMKFGVNTINGLRDGNYNRISNAKRQSTDNSKYKRRLARGLKKRKKDSDVSKEGKTYIPGQW